MKSGRNETDRKKGRIRNDKKERVSDTLGVSFLSGVCVKVQATLEKEWDLSFIKDILRQEGRRK